MSQVFISYRHSDTHSPRVADLAKALHAAGVNVVIDSDQLPGGPNEGWPKWSQQQVEKADKVLIACTQGWHECYEANGPLEIGHGCAAEAHIVRQMLYNQGFDNDRLRVVLLTPENVKSIPIGLQAYHCFHWYKPKDQTDLLAWLTAAAPSPAAPQPPTIPWPTLHAPFDRRMANRDAEFQLFEAMLQGRSAQRALLIQGESGRGKSMLVNSFIRLARQLRLGHTLIDCQNPSWSLDSVLNTLENDMTNASNSLAGETSEQHRRRLLTKLKALAQPHLLLLDSFEKAPGELKQWLEDDVLARLLNCPALVVVVCGQSVPKTQGKFWQDDVHSLALPLIANPEAWHACYQHVPADFIQNLVCYTKGDPAVISRVLDGALQQGSPA